MDAGFIHVFEDFSLTRKLLSLSIIWYPKNSQVLKCRKYYQSSRKLLIVLIHCAWMKMHILIKLKRLLGYVVNIFAYSPPSDDYLPSKNKKRIKYKFNKNGPLALYAKLLSSQLLHPIGAVFWWKFRGNLKTCLLQSLYCSDCYKILFKWAWL